MNVGNPRRILAVSLTGSSHHLSSVIKDLTGTHPEQTTDSANDTTTLAGTTHSLALSTAYYKAEVPIWLDLIADPAEWAESFLSAEAREVLDVLGGLVLVFGLPSRSTPTGETAPGDDMVPPVPLASQQPPPSHEQTRGVIEHVGRVVREGLGGWEWDGVGLAVGVGDVDVGADGLDVLDEWEDACAEWGLEFVHVPVKEDKGRGKNDFGEKVGIPRVLETLQSNDWSQGGGFGDEGEDEGSDLDELGGSRKRVGTVSRTAVGTDGDDHSKEEGPDLDPESLEFGFDRDDFAGLKKAIWTTGDEGGEEDGAVGEEDVQKLEGMMRKLLAVRDMGAGLPEEQRKRMAKQAVGEVMKEI